MSSETLRRTGGSESRVLDSVDLPCRLMTVKLLPTQKQQEGSKENQPKYGNRTLRVVELD